MSLMARYLMDGDENQEITNLGLSNIIQETVTNKSVQNGGLFFNKTASCQILWPSIQATEILCSRELSFSWWLKPNSGNISNTTWYQLFGNNGRNYGNNQAWPGRFFSTYIQASGNQRTLHVCWFTTDTNDAKKLCWETIGTEQLPVDQWSHVCITYAENSWNQQSTIKIYINGECKRTINNLFCMGSTNNGYNPVGYYPDTVAVHKQTQVLINDFRVYNHCLSVKEIKDLAQGMSGYYNFDGVVTRNGGSIIVNGTYAEIDETNDWGYCCNSADVIKQSNLNSTYILEFDYYIKTSAKTTGGSDSRLRYNATPSQIDNISAYMESGSCCWDQQGCWTHAWIKFECSSSSSESTSSSEATSLIVTDNSTTNSIFIRNAQIYAADSPIKTATEEFFDLQKYSSSTPGLQGSTTSSCPFGHSSFATGKDETFTFKTLKTLNCWVYSEETSYNLKLAIDTTDITANTTDNTANTTDTQEFTVEPGWNMLTITADAKYVNGIKQGAGWGTDVVVNSMILTSGQICHEIKGYATELSDQDIEDLYYNDFMIDKNNNVYVNNIAENNKLYNLIDLDNKHIDISNGSFTKVEDQLEDATTDIHIYCNKVKKEDGTVYNSNLFMVWYDTFVQPKLGHKYYGYIKQKASENIKNFAGDDRRFEWYVYGPINGVSEKPLVFVGGTPITTEWQIYSNIIEYTEDTAWKDLHYYIRNFICDYGQMTEYPDMYWSEPFLIDLTDWFGAGNEPSKDWCDKYLTVSNYKENLHSQILQIGENNSLELMDYKEEPIDYPLVTSLQFIEKQCKIENEYEYYPHAHYTALEIEYWDKDSKYWKWRDCWSDLGSAGFTFKLDGEGPEYYDREFTEPVTWTYNFNPALQIRRIHTVRWWKGANTRSYHTAVGYSTDATDTTDNKTYFTIGDQLIQATPEGELYCIPSITKSIAMPVKYIRLYANGSNRNSLNHLEFIRLKIQDMGPLVGLLNDLLPNADDTGKTPQQLKEEGKDSYSKEYLKTIDGTILQQEGYWFCADRSIVFELTNVYNVEQIIVARYWADTRKYKDQRVEVSADGQYWTTLYNVGDFTSNGYGYTESSQGYIFTTPCKHQDIELNLQDNALENATIIEV